MNKKEKILISVGCALLIVIFITMGFLLLHNKESIEVKVIDEVNGEYMLTGVPTDYKFEINLKENAEINPEDFVVTKLTGEEVNTINNCKKDVCEIAPPEKGYEKGELYQISLNGKGTFKNKIFSKADTLLFCVEKKKTQEINYDEDVKKVPGRKIEIEGEQIILDGDYENGDVIITDINNDHIDETYKLSDVENTEEQTIANIDEPSLDEVYESADIFLIEDVNLSKAEIDKEAFTGILTETGIMSAFIDSAYAAEDVRLEIEKVIGKKGEYSFELTIKDPSDESRQLKIKFSLRDQIGIKFDGDLAMFTNTLIITDKLQFSVEGKDKKKVEADIKKATDQYLEDIGDQEPDKSEVPLVPIDIPVAGPVCVYINLGMMAEQSFSTDLNATMNNQIALEQGIFYSFSQDKVIKQYGESYGKTDSDIMVKGQFNAFAGAYIEAGIKLTSFIRVGLDAVGGAYIDAVGCFIVEGIPKDVNYTGYYDIECGLEFKVDGEIRIIGDEDSFNIVDLKKPLYEKSDYLDILDVNLADTYTNNSGEIYLEPLEATYVNKINGETETREIEKFELEINKKPVVVKDNTIKFEPKEEMNSFKLKWKDEGKHFEFEKDIKITEANSNNAEGVESYFDFMGLEISDIEDKYGELITVYEDEFFTWYGLPGKPICICEYPNHDSKCWEVAGMTSDILGIDEGIEINELCRKYSLGAEDFNSPEGFSIYGYDDTIVQDVNAYGVNGEYEFHGDTFIEQRQAVCEYIGIVLKNQYFYGTFDFNGIYSGYNLNVEMEDFMVYPDNLCRITTYMQYPVWMN